MTFPSAREIVADVASGAVSAGEVVDAHIRRIEEVNPKLNAMVVPLFDQARRDAAVIDAARHRGDNLGPLAGLPFTVKESFDVADTPTTMGLTTRASHRAAVDAPYVARLRQAGAILLGKTNISQLLMGNESDNPLYGRTNNPWNAGRAPGGSSGGEAALIAAGGSPLGLGSDIGGSVRLPAHACGIHAIKPTSGRMTMAGHAGLYPGQEAIQAQPGLMARSVSDLVLGLDVLGPLPHTTAEPLRVGFYTHNGITAAAPALRRAVREAAAALAGCGAHVEEWTPPDMSEAWVTYLGILFADGSASARRIARGSKLTPAVQKVFLSGRLPRTLLAGISAPILHALRQHHLAETMRGMGHITADQYWQLLARRTAFCQDFAKELDRRQFDAIICPPDAVPALRHDTRWYLAFSYAAIWNLLGMPAGVVAATRVRPDEESDRMPGVDVSEREARRCEQQSAGLPVGVQVIARHEREDVVLRVMNTLEERFRRSPDYPVLQDATPAQSASSAAGAG